MDNTDVQITGSFRYNGNVRVRYRFGDKELEAEGPATEVEKHAVAFLSLAGEGKPVQLQLPEPVIVIGEGAEVKTPLLGESSDVAEKINGSVAHENSLDLVSFYHTLSPKSQNEQIVAVTFFGGVHEARDFLTFDDYAEAFDKLLRAGKAAKPPRNQLRDMVNNAEKRGLIYRVRNGAFALKDKGMEMAQRMISQE